MSPSGSGTARAPSRLSVGVAIGSGAAIALLVGYLAWHAVTGSPPASIRVAVVTREAREEEGLAYVPLEVTNEGGRAVSELLVETTFAPQGAAPIVERARIDYLAGGERRRIVAVGPPGAPLDARVVGYQEP